MKYLVPGLLVLFALSVSNSVWANNQAENFVRAETIISDKALKKFLDIYNTSTNKKIRQDGLYFNLASLNENQQTFVAAVCQKMNACTAKEENNAQEFLLLTADINNDRNSEYILLRLAPTADAPDKILGVFTLKNKALMPLPFSSIINSSFGDDAKHSWPKHINDPFITRKGNENYFNFQDVLIWKDENGDQIFSHQLDKAAYGEMSFYRYLWKNDTIVLDYKDTIQRKRQINR